MKRLDIINKSWILFFCYLVSPFGLMAQLNNEAINKVNNIKMNESMIFGEAFDTNEGIAIKDAMSRLLSYANELRSEAGNIRIIATDIKDIVQELKYFDGNRYNILIYAPRYQILTVESNPERNSMSESNNNDTTMDYEYAGTRGTQDSNVSQNSISDNSGKSVDNVQVSQLPKDIMETLCSQDTWFEIKGFLSTFKNQGKIQATGFCTNIPEIPKDAYQILIDDKYGILAILSPQCVIDRINYKTHNFDSEYNYPNCKVYVWFK